MLANVMQLAADHRLTDDLIISGILSGKTDDFEILVRRYNGMLYKTACGILNDEDDIEDVMQETYIRGFEKLHQFRSEAKFSTWLTRILINCALQHANKLKGKHHLDIDALKGDDANQLSETPAFADKSSEVGEGLGRAIQSAISQIPPRYRIVFVLREVERYSVEETASILNISEDNVKIRLHRAKGMLREILKSSLESLDVFEFHATRCARMAEQVMNRLNGMTARSML
jgi:RNA polymerase sigma factor (sigma-70 family)